MNRSKIIIISLSILLLISIGFHIFQYINYKNNVYKINYYIEMRFVDNNKTITFADIPMKEIKVIKGDRHPEMESRNYPAEKGVDIMTLKGDYHLRYQDLDIVINKESIIINGKVMKDNVLMIDNEKRFTWHGRVNYWEIPVSKVEEYEKYGRIIYPFVPAESK